MNTKCQKTAKDSGKQHKFRLSVGSWNFEKIFERI
jgi:hypothetical protein